MKKCVGVGCVTECGEESREREKRNSVFWNENERNDRSLVKKKRIKKENTKVKIGRR